MTQLVIVVIAVVAIAYAAWYERRLDPRDRADLRRLPRLDTRPTPGPPPIHFTRDPSPKPRRKEPAA